MDEYFPSMTIGGLELQPVHEFIYRQLVHEGNLDRNDITSKVMDMLNRRGKIKTKGKRKEYKQAINRIFLSLRRLVMRPTETLDQVCLEDVMERRRRFERETGYRKT